MRMALIAGIPRPAMTTARWRGVTAMRPVGSVMVVIMGTIQGDEKALRNLKKKATIMVNRKMKKRRTKIWKGKQEIKLEKSRKQKDKTEGERQAKTKQRHRASKQSYFQNVVESERGGFQ